MRSLRVLALLRATVIAASAASDQTALRRLWASRAYSPAPIPAEWRVDGVRARDLSAFEQWDGRTIRVSDVIARFGTPDRYLVARRAGNQDFLVYDLPLGHTAAFHLSRGGREHFLAGVIIDPRGKLLRLISDHAKA
jgi:hypothetical protein